jgi:hypothetical protein
MGIQPQAILEAMLGVIKKSFISWLVSARTKYKKPKTREKIL